jgi:GntR family phosphonate transport system transcriptional regulator
MTIQMTRGLVKPAKRAGAMRTAESAGFALWRRVADQLERAIADGRYPVDTRLPGEIDIAQRLGVNRHTVRRALAALAARGFVRAERGSGTYVETARLRYPIRSRTRFSRDRRRRRPRAGRPPLLRSGIEEAEPEIARRLALAPRTAVIRLDILRSVDRVPVSARRPGCRLTAPRMPAASTGKPARSPARWRESASRTFAARARGSQPPSPRRRCRAAAACARPPADRGGQHRRHRRRTPILTTRARLAADRIELVIET